MAGSLSLNIRAACVPMLLVAAYAALVLASPAVSVAEIMPLLGAHLRKGLFALIAFSMISVFLLLIVKLVRGDTEERPLALIGRTIRTGWERDRLLSVAIPPFYFALLLSSFSAFKQTILPLAGFGLDPAFAEIDRALFLGVDPWRLTHWLVPGPIGTWFIDRAYVAWFVPLLLFVLLSWLAPLRLRTQFLLAFASVWMLLGTAMAFLLPGAGPCYYGRFHPGGDMFAAMNERLAMQNDWLIANGWGDLKALAGQEELLLIFDADRLQLAAGISAMPSLHNALAVIFACAAFGFGRAAGWAMSIFAALILFGSVHLGWHYAIDGLVGGACALLVWQGAGMAARRLLQAPAEGREAPATGQPALL